MLKGHTFGLTPQKTRLPILLFTIAACAASVLYVGFIMAQEIVYTHFFYIPIILAGIWYYKKAIYVAFFLGIVHILVTYLSTQAVTLGNFQRCAILIAVAYVIGLISESRAKGQEELRETRDYLDSLIRYANVPIIVWDPELRITRFNRAFEHLTGYTADEVIGQELSMLFPEASRDKSLSKIARTLRGQYWELVEIPILRKDGDIRLALWNSANIYVPDSKILVATIAQGTDITERKNVEEALVRSEKLKALGEMAAGVAHDFNNLLAIILGNAQLLERGMERYKSEEIKERLKILVRTAEEGGKTVRRLQHFTCREASRQHFTRIDLNEIVRSAIASISPRWKDEAEANGTAIRIKEKLGKLPPLLGSRSELMEVLTNLIFNALEAMPEGGEITVKTEAKENEVYFYFTDSGKGIPKKIKGKIFDPFFTTKGPQASGLGLSVSCGIIERHQGKIKVDSTEGKGTTFTISIPIPLQTPQDEEKLEAPEKISSRKILLIDDEEGIRDVLGTIFKDEGHRVTLAGTGTKGLDQFKQSDFDLVLADLGMPEMSGWELAKKIKEIDPGIPVGLITGWGVAITKEKMKEEGVDFILLKPFDCTKVLKEVQTVLKM